MKADQSQASSSNHNPQAATNESIKSIAESVGIGNLSDEACRDLVSDLSFTIKLILNDAQKFARRSRRKKMIPSDIDYALKNRNFEPIYGFYTNEPTPFKCTTSLGGTGSGRSIYYFEDQVVNLDELISTNNQSIKLPNDFVINAHWLAIEGVQPAVAENPQFVTKDLQKKETIEGTNLTKQKEQLREQQTPIGETLVKLKTLVPHDLSMEQQIYFKEITEACVGPDESKRTEALNSLQIDPGLHQLLPRFIIFISEGVRLNIAQFNMPMLIHLMRISKSLIDNKTIFLEKYLHELLPSIFSCLLSKQLCARPDVEDHYALREFCASLIGQIVKTYTPTIVTLQTRIINNYLNILKSEKNTFATLYGAIVGLAELGSEIVETFIFPLVKPLGERISQILDSTATSQEKLPGEKIKIEIIKIVSDVLKTKPTKPGTDEFDYLATEFGAYFGPLFHSELMKYRSQKKSVAQAMVAAAVNSFQNV